MSNASEAPRAHAHVTGDSAQITTVNGAIENVTAPDADGLRRAIVDRVRADAASSGTTLELHTTGDRGTHELLVDPDGELIAIYDDRTLTRAELRQHAWWVTDVEPAADEGPVDEPAADEEPAEEPVAEDEEPAAEVRSDEDEVTDMIAPRAASDPGDDDDLDEDTFTARISIARTAAVPSVPQFFLPAAAEPQTRAIDDAPEPEGAPRVTEIPADEPVVPAEPSPEPMSSPEPVSEFESQPAVAPEPEPVPVSASPMASGIGDTLPDVPTTASTAVAGAAVVRPRFIDPAPEHPATVAGWRALFAKLGLPVGPSKAEIERAEREKAVSRQWAGCRAIAVANGKGGVGKTMTTAVLSAVFARHGGGNVLAWDNNDTRGTLGWRTEQGDYDTTIRDLLPQARQLLEATASVSDISRYVHHQSIDRYDVLRSNPELLAADQRITTADFDLLAQVAARYYRMVIFDSGNDESADRWLRMIDSAHQLVVPTLAAPESAESAALLLDALRKRDEHSRRLAEGAVVIVGQSEKSSAAAVQQIAAGFEGHVRAVQVIPFDDALKAGRIRYDALQPKTRDAWMQAAAAVADGL